MEKLAFLRPVKLNRKIRLGPPLDGGYVVYERILHEMDALVTYGVGWDIRFERHFQQLTGKAVRMFDPSMFDRHLLNVRQFKRNLLRLRFLAIVRQVRLTWNLWKLKKELESKNIYFINEGIAVLQEGKYNTFQSHMERFLLEGKRVILKIDIEGGEYNIFLDKAIYDHMDGVDQLIVEFHDVKKRLRDLKKIITDLGRNFSLVHIHGNNWGPTFKLYDLGIDQDDDIEIPDTLELLWVRTSRILKEDISEECISYPIQKLDYPNNPKKEDYALKFI